MGVAEYAHSMRRSFLICLFSLVCAAFVVTGTLAYWQFQRQAEQQAEQLMTTRLRDMLELVDYSINSMQRLRRNNDEMALARARALAEIIRLNPATLTEQEVLQGLCNDLGAEQVAITDGKAVIVAAVPASYIGYDLSGDKDASKFLPCITTPGHEYVQREEEQLKSTGLQYVGVHRQDAEGLIRVGFRPQYEQRAREATAYSRLAANHRLGTTGRILAFRGGAALNRESLPGPAADFLAMPTGELKRLRLNSEEHFAYALEKNGFRLVGIVPLRDFYPTGARNLRSRLLANCIVLVAVFTMVSFLLHHLVISRLSRINETLRRIAEGDTEARVNVDSSPEFIRLSTGINSMLDSIKVMNDQSPERLRKEMELARFMQRNALPSTFPAFPNHSEFDIYATLMPSINVGGDFYDFFMTDADHLTFMVASVSGIGVPAALFMMRSLSIIRGFARTGQSPEVVLSGANRTLCEGRTEEMNVALFYASLELSTGVLTCINAGHEAPLLQHLGSGQYVELALTNSPVLGAIEGVRYRSEQVQLEPGDRLLLFTDGLFHAQNAQKEHFSMPLLLRALEEGKALTLTDLPNLVRKALRRFTHGMPQEDDITILALEYQSIMRHGGQVCVTAGEPQAVQKLLQESLEAVLAAPLDIDALQTATSSILSTLPAETPLTVVLGCNEDHAELSLSYPGELLNPLEHLAWDGITATHVHSHTEGNRLSLSKHLG